jgi:hypothetical protein
MFNLTMKEKGFYMSKLNVRTIAIVVSILALAALACTCGGVDLGNITGGGTTGGGGGGSATVTLNNNSGSTVCYVYISPNTETTWGSDWLGTTEVINNGSSRVFTGITPGVYDLRADDCNNNTLYEEYGINISGSYTWNIP